MSANWREAPPAPAQIRPFTFPLVTRRALDNGITLLHARQGRIPVAAVRVVIAAGAGIEPAEQAGLARLVASTLDAGTDRHDGPQLAWEFERLGVELETEAGWDAITLAATVPLTRIEPTVALIAEVARRAVFGEREVERVRGEQLAQILQRKSEPRALADDSALRFIFADGTRYAAPLVGSRPSVAALGREDVVGFHDAVFAAHNVALVIAGDLDLEAATDLAGRYFGDWQGEGVPPLLPHVRPRTRSTDVHIVRRTGAVQSELRVGHVGVARSHPDHVPLIVMNSILGGMFTSRLNLNLRERHGFTYGVRSGFGFRRAGGTFIIATAVAADVTARAVEEALGEFHRMHAEGPLPDEVAAARDYMAGVMPLVLQTSGEVADALTRLFMYDLPNDWHARHREALLSVPAEEVARVAHQHLHPEQAAIVVVGDPDRITADLQALGIGDVQVHEAE